MLNWLDNSENENYFSVERSSDNTNFTSIAFLNRNVITYKDSSRGFQTGQSYQYRIKSYSNTDSAVSNTVSIIYRSSVLIPPKSLTANYNSNIGVIQLAWINDDNNILSIDIERKTESSNFTLQRRIDSSNDFYLDSVSYTHLRAHETVLDLVCRLLLEKNKTTQKKKKKTSLSSIYSRRDMNQHCSRTLL